ncbi:MAG: GspH/FimT family pseudopilin [Gammaproteobacteria bacterium]|nr:GspH/FimT family pseudopilin [Gammaproteobacteria bacterium]MDH3449307.1 GspH/FimT family pseudopilin [Gammaproteobacteria bacterium]
MKKKSGFTLLELLIAVALVGIVMAFGLPSMTEFIKNDRLTTQINTLVGHLAYARSEAVLRHQPVIVCASDNQASCSSGNWADGWIIFVDTDNNGDFSAGEVMLRVQQPLAGGNTLVSTAGNSVVYDDRGFAPNSIGSFSLCDDRGPAHIKAITISNTGRVRKGGSASCV